MSHNSFGTLFKVTSWGESHGEAIGCVIDGCPPNIRFSQKEMRHFMKKRRPGQSNFVTQRQEQDEVEILSGVLSYADEREGVFYVTTGAPISIIIKNNDFRSRDYDSIEQIYRPSHGDYSYDIKYGIRDPLGGGRYSARETATRVAAGVIARKILPEVRIYGAVTAIGEIKIDPKNWDFQEIESNEFFCPDAMAAQKMSDYIKNIRKEGSSIGGEVTLIAKNVPKGLGAPLYGKLDQDIASYIMSINAVKAVEIGAGFDVITMRGEENADEMMLDKNGAVVFGSNNAGGILAGISTGQDIIVRFAVKPTASISKSLRSLNNKLEQVSCSVKGRHDPCIAIRAVAVGEAMLSCLLADHFLRHRGQIGQSDQACDINQAME